MELLSSHSMAAKTDPIVVTIVFTHGTSICSMIFSFIANFNDCWGLLNLVHLVISIIIGQLFKIGIILILCLLFFQLHTKSVLNILVMFIFPKIWSFVMFFFILDFSYNLVSVSCLLQ